MARFISRLGEIAEDFDYFIIDLWGVIHDGEKTYPNVLETIHSLREQNKKIIFLSNAPRRSSVVVSVLDSFGISSNYYDSILTSGDVTYRHMQESWKLGKSYYYIGPEKDRNLLAGLDYKEASHAKEADFALCVGFDHDETSMDRRWKEAETCLKEKLPLVCANPDQEVVKLDGKRILCAGLIAEKYQQYGGEVLYFGKPYAAVYEECLRLFGTKNTSRVIAIGDGLHTDIKGANMAGMYSVLVTGGILSMELKEKATEQNLLPHFKRHGATPDAVISAFVW